MKTTRRTRRTTRTAGLVALAAAAALSLTACGSDGGNGNGGKDDNAAGAKPAAASTDSEAKGADGADVRSQSAASGVKRTTCDLDTVQVRLKRTGGTAPVILLKATNQGDSRCDLYGYPFVGYPDAQAPIPVGGGQPQSVVSLKPGKSAYASLSLEKGSGNNMHREKELTIELANRKLQGTGSTATLTAPGAGLALSDNSTVSYWNTTPELAM